MKRHDIQEAAGQRQPAGARDSNTTRAAATAPPDSARMVSQAAQLKRLRAGTPEPEATTVASSEGAGPGRGGLPAQLRAGLEAMSGQDLGDVRVHYGSSKPAQLEAHAYAQGRDIHLAPGQEQHLAHEAWHVVQQAQGRVKPTTTLGGGVPVNDHGSLEREADLMGARARNAAPVQRKSRIDLDHDKTKGKKDEIAKKIEDLKAAKREAKRVKTAAWVTNASTGKDDARDTTFNTDIAAIRQKYEEDIVALASSYGASDALVSGSAYYGTELAEQPGVFKRADNHKEYVKDRRDTFVPRYVRRELNKKDNPNHRDGLIPRGASTYGSLVKKFKQKKKPRNIILPADTDQAAAISWNHREYLQQAIGGGKNQFALSLSSTKRPVLSNDHKTFADKSSAVVVDLAAVPKQDIGAQWQINATHGHKEALPTGFLPAIAKDREDKKAQQATRVSMSGYRNMEVVARSVPKAAIVHTWNGPEGPQSVYKDGVSPRGGLLASKRRELEAPPVVVAVPTTEGETTGD